MRPDLFIGGKWRSGRGQAFASHDPTTGDVVWRGAGASAEDVSDAMAAAHAAFPAWAGAPLEKRIGIAQAFAKIVETRAAEFAETISREMGKAGWDARGEVAAMVGKIAISVRAQAERAGERRDDQPFGAATLAHRPHGVMAVFGPFNFPGHLPNGHIVPALLAGNTIVFKPSELTPAAGALMAEAWEAAGLPAGVLNLVQGARDVGAALLEAPQLAGVLFTGSANVGAQIHRQFAGRPEIVLALEMGGNNPLIVWPGADASVAANLIAHSAFLTSGQRCSCARRLIVPHGAFGDAVIEASVALAKQIVVGPWTQSPEPFYGPLVNARAAENVRAFEADLIARGAKPILRAEIDGALVRPALIESTGVAVPDEECFGPLLQVIRVATVDEAIAQANATRFGLAGGVISDDPELWTRVSHELRAGVLNWNRPTTGASSALPFGGPGLSGSLRPSAYYAADYAAYPVASQIAQTPAALPAPGLPQ